jgi:hypothetical protein
MFKCEICEREFNDILGLAMHITRTHKISPAEYYLRFNPSRGKCKICGNDTKFISLSQGYRDHCSNKCTMNDPESREKGRLTCMKNHGCENPMQSNEIKNKQEETCLKNNGCKNPAQNIDIKNKRLKTNNINFGCDHPMQNKKIAAKNGKVRRLKFSKAKIKYPDVFLVEDLKEGLDGEILARCRNANCKNSKENDGWFEVLAHQVISRNKGIKNSDFGYFYCCEECKHECILYRKSAKQLENILNPINTDNQASQSDLLVWRNEVFNRQLLENLNHKENFCEKCHSIENLHCHHEMPQKLYPGYSLDPINGVIFCEKCHFELGHTKGTECSTGNLANKICK